MDDNDDDARARLNFSHDEEEELFFLLMIETMERNTYRNSLTGVG